MKYEGLAGVSIGKPSDTVVLVGEDGSTKDLVIKNRLIYVKKCLRDNSLGGILLCDKSRGDTVFSLVLAVSDGCGKWHKLTKEQKARGEVAGLNMSIKPNMKVMTPDDHPWGIVRSPFGRDEFFIREDIIKCVVEDE